MELSDRILANRATLSDACDDLSVTADQITIVERDREPHKPRRTRAPAVCLLAKVAAGKRPNHGSTRLLRTKTPSSVRPSEVT